MRVLCGLAALFLTTSLPLWSERLPSIATWNLQNLLLLNRYEDGRFRLDYPMPEARKASIRKLIIEASPDLLFLQEVGSMAFLLELQLDLAASGLHYPHAAFSGFPDARTGLAFLSRFPEETVIFHEPGSPGDAASLKRGIQEVVISIGSTRIRFFHVHLKSRYSSDSGDPDARLPRQVEIASLAAFLARQQDAFPASPMVVLGDFNTPFGDPLMAPLLLDWSPLPAIAVDGSSWTYQHRKSGTRERLDGFWIPRNGPAFLSPLPVIPVASTPSDHRLVQAALFFQD